MDVASLPSLIAIPNSFGAPPSSPQPGEIVDALVLAVLDNGAVRLQLPDGIIDVRTAVALEPGAKVRVAVNSTSAGLQLTVLTDGSGRAISAPAALISRGLSPVEAPTAVAPPSQNPQSAAADTVAAAIQMAAARQGGLAPLMADLEQGTSQRTLPAAVAAAAARVLGARIPLTENLAAADIRQALARSGVFLEARLGASSPADTNTGPDLKSALLVFRQVSKAWVAATADAPASAARPAGPSAPPPPYRGAPPAAQPVASPSLPTNDTGAIAVQLLGETEAALARQTLLQVASLPDSSQQNGPPASRSAAWAFEIPLATAQGTAVAQFEITRDGGGASPDLPGVWRVRFSLDIEPMGPLHAHVALLGARTSVTLWAEREESAARLRGSTALLAEGLRAAALEPGQIECRVGTPAAPPPAAGRFLDRAS